MPSRQDPKRPVATRYFGVFEDGSLKVRGLACRRRDTPPLVRRAQEDLLARMAGAGTARELAALKPELEEMAEGFRQRLREGSVKPRDLVITRVLPQPLADYKVDTPTALAARQLEAAGHSPAAGREGALRPRRKEGRSQGVPHPGRPVPGDPRRLRREALPGAAGEGYRGNYDGICRPAPCHLTFPWLFKGGVLYYRKIRTSIGRTIVKKTFTVVIEKDPESGWLVGEVVELPGCYSQAPDIASLEANMREAIKAYLNTGITEEPLPSFVGTWQLEVQA